MDGIGIEPLPSICTQHYSPVKQLFHDHVTLSMFLAMFYELPLCGTGKSNPVSKAPNVERSEPLVFHVMKKRSDDT
ncbi:hypothetical protein STEG23_033483 [Scotinomys teguina]